MTKHTHTSRFLSAGGFHYDVHCTPVAALPGQFNLRVTSQWDEARRPNEKQVALNLTLSREQLGSLADVLNRALATIE